MILIIIGTNLNASCDGKNFVKFVDYCVFEFKKVNPDKYKSIRGIEIVFNTDASISSFFLYFSDNSIVLSNEEYNYLLAKLQRKKYKCYVKTLYKESDLPSGEKLKWKKKIVGR